MGANFDFLPGLKAEDSHLRQQEMSSCCPSGLFLL